MEDLGTATLVSIQGRVLELEHDIGDRVYLVTDPDQKQRLVTAITVRPGPKIVYELSCGDHSYWADAIEISRERDVLIVTEG